MSIHVNIDNELSETENTKGQRESEDNRLLIAIKLHALTPPIVQLHTIVNVETKYS